MSKFPCVNTIELNRYLDGLDAAEARDEEIARIAEEDIEPEIYESEENCEAIAELLQDADNNDDVLFVKACIIGGYSSQSLDDLLTIGVECSHCHIAEILHEHENLPEHAQAIAEEYAQAEALKQAEKKLEEIERNGPDY